MGVAPASSPRRRYAASPVAATACLSSTSRRDQPARRLTGKTGEAGEHCRGQARPLRTRLGLTLIDDEECRWCARVMPENLGSPLDQDRQNDADSRRRLQLSKPNTTTDQGLADERQRAFPPNRPVVVDGSDLVAPSSSWVEGPLACTSR